MAKMYEIEQNGLGGSALPSGPIPRRQGWEGQFLMCVEYENTTFCVMRNEYCVLRIAYCVQADMTGVMSLRDAGESSGVKQDLHLLSVLSYWWTADGSFE